MISIKAMCNIFDFLANRSKAIESYGENEITVDMNDINEEYVYDGDLHDVEEVIQIMAGENVKVSTSYGDGNWITFTFEAV